MASHTDGEAKRALNPSSVKCAALAGRYDVAQIAADDAFQTATTAWRRFLAAAETLPAKQALPLWQEIHEKAESRIYTRPILDPLSLRT